MLQVKVFYKKIFKENQVFFRSSSTCAMEKYCPTTGKTNKQTHRNE